MSVDLRKETRNLINAAEELVNAISAREMLNAINAWEILNAANARSYAIERPSCEKRVAEPKYEQALHNLVVAIRYANKVMDRDANP